MGGLWRRLGRLLLGEEAPNDPVGDSIEEVDRDQTRGHIGERSSLKRALLEDGERTDSTNKNSPETPEDGADPLKAKMPVHAIHT